MRREAPLDCGTPRDASSRIRLIEFSVISLVNRNGRDFQMGFWLVPFVTLVIWASQPLRSLRERILHGFKPFMLLDSSRGFVQEIF